MNQLEEPEAYSADEGWQSWQGDELHAWYAGRRHGMEKTVPGMKDHVKIGMKR